MSSGTAREGCVSFICIATLSANRRQSELLRWNRRTASAREQATRKYSWIRRKPLPHSIENRLDKERGLPFQPRGPE